MLGASGPQYATAMAAMAWLQQQAVGAISHEPYDERPLLGGATGSNDAGHADAPRYAGGAA